MTCPAGRTPQVQASGSVATSQYRTRLLLGVREAANVSAGAERIRGAVHLVDDERRCSVVVEQPHQVRGGDRAADALQRGEHFCGQWRRRHGSNFEGGCPIAALGALKSASRVAISRSAAGLAVAIQARQQGVVSTAATTPSPGGCAATGRWSPGPAATDGRFPARRPAAPPAVAAWWSADAGNSAAQRPGSPAEFGWCRSADPN